MTENESGLNNEELSELLIKKLNHLKEIEEYGKDSPYIKELSDIALIQLQLGQFSESEQNYDICLRHFRKQKDRLGQAAVLGVLATLYFKKSDFLKSIKFFEESYNIYDELNQIQEKITCLKGIGNAYIKLNQFDEAGAAFLDCSAICSDSDDLYNLLDCLGRLIFIHEMTKNWDVVYELYKKVLKAFKELKDIKGIITTYFNLGILQKKNNHLEDALRFFKKGTNVAIESNYGESMIKGLGYVGETLFYLGRQRDAKDQFLKALHIANEIKANNARIQLKILLKSLGLSDYEILNELKDHKETNYSKN
jgi:tetratricopeptide (TPR) repeat protein